MAGHGNSRFLQRIYTFGCVLNRMSLEKRLDYDLGFCTVFVGTDDSIKSLSEEELAQRLINKKEPWWEPLFPYIRDGYKAEDVYLINIRYG